MYFSQQLIGRVIDYYLSGEQVRKPLPGWDANKSIGNIAGDFMTPGSPVTITYESNNSVMCISDQSMHEQRVLSVDL